MAYSSGTAALHGAYFAAGIGQGDEIVTSAITFAATSNAAVYLGARPVFADVSPSTGLIDLNAAKSKITGRTRALVGIDFAGQPCDYDGLAALAREKGADLYCGRSPLTGWCLQRPSGRITGRYVRAQFSPGQINHHRRRWHGFDKFKEIFRINSAHFRTHGIEKDPAKLSVCEGPWYHEMQILGFNYRMCDLQAALGASQMQSIDKFVKRRREIAALYRQKLAESSAYQCAEELEGRDSSYHLFPIFVNKTPYADTRKFVFEALHAENIGVQVHYIPTYKFPYYKQLLDSDLSGTMPGTEEFYSREIGLPIFVSMTDKDVDDVILALERLPLICIATRWCRS